MSTQQVTFDPSQPYKPAEAAPDPYASIAQPIAADPYASIAQPTAQTVPLFDPKGTLGDVPYDQMNAAIAAGGKRAVRMKDPSGNPGWIPEDRVQDAVRAGGSVIFDPSGPYQAAPKESDQPSAASRLGSNFLSGAGVTSDEQAKNFFVHPLDTVIKSFEAQGQLAKKARDAYDKGDYLGALQHAANYLVPFVGQQTDQAGDQLKQGDIAGGIGRTLGAAAPIVAGSPEVRALPGEALDTATSAAKAGAPYVKPVAKAVAQTDDAATFDRMGKIWNAWKNVPEEIRANGPQFSDPGAPLPEAPPPELLQARGLQQGGHTPAPEPSAALGDLPVHAVQQAIKELGPQAPIADITARANEISGTGIPRTLSGESALRQVLTGQDNTNLLKIAKGRGVNVTQESQLKPGIADTRIINKIVDDFSPDELQELRNQYLENSRFHHAFGDIGPEAWKTMSLQTYFPDLKIPAAQLARTQKAIATTPAASDDLTGILQQSLAAIKARQ